MSTGGLDSPPARAPIWDTERDAQIESARHRHPLNTAVLVAMGLVLCAGLVWFIGVLLASANTTSPFGLLADTAPTTVLAVVLAGAAFGVACLAPDERRGGLLTAAVAVFAVVAHATPVFVTTRVRGALLSADARAVEQAAVSGELAVPGLTPDSGDWSGLRALLATLTDASGVSADAITRWAPVAIVGVSLTAIWLLCRAMGLGARAAAAAQWLFVAGSWIGAAQLTSVAVGSALALAIGVLLITFDGAGAPAALFPDSRPPDSTGALATVVILSLFSLVGVAMVDPLASLGLLFVFVVAARSETAYTWWAATFAAIATAAAAIGPVRDSAVGIGETLTAHRGAPIETSGATALADAIDRWNIVLVAGRFVALALIAGALLGLLIFGRLGRSVNLIGIMCLVPFFVTLVIDPSFEHAYQAMFIALPWLAIAAAIALRPILTTETAGRLPLVGSCLLLTIVGVAGVIASSGQERARDLGGAVSEELARPLPVDVFTESEEGG